MLEDTYNHALSKVRKAGANVSTLACDGEAGFADGRGAEVRFSWPTDVVLTGTGEYAVSDSGNHAIRMMTDEGKVCTLVGNGEAGLGVLPNGDLVVADEGNHAIRVVTMEGSASTLVGTSAPSSA